MTPVRRIAVLGAGTMGSRIAAHFVNAGVPALLLDLTAETARQGLETALKQRPAPFFSSSGPSMIAAGGFETDLGRIADCDWVIEAIVEDLGAKQALLARVAEVRRRGTLLSTNTSGIPLRRIAEHFSQELQRNFLGTHFFNPPRYLHLVEIIPGPGTDPQVIQDVAAYCDVRLGKGVVPCKDTPNFIGNRIGAFFSATVHKITAEGGYTTEEVDALTGQLIGLPRSASYRLMDIIGLDVWARVLQNLSHGAVDDPWHSRFALPRIMEEMLARGWLGEKSGQGFYKRAGKEILVLDWKTLDYRPAGKVRHASLEAAEKTADLSERLRQLVSANDRAGMFLWELLSDYCLYAASLVPEISDRVVEIDRAMRWGYAHQLGPFELFDSFGVEPTVRRAEREGRKVPESLGRMLRSGSESFYRSEDSARIPRTGYFDLAGAGYRILEERPGVIVLSDLKRARGVITQNAGASLIDLGDGVLCLEFHSKMNTLGEDTLAMIFAALEETARNFEAMVIGNQGEQFSAGGDLRFILAASRGGNWEVLEAFVRRLQQATIAVKYSPKPVVAAPFGMTLGAGCQLVLHAAAVQASAEAYMGLVEAGVGLLPAAGGCKEMLLRTAAKQAFDLISKGRTSGSAAEAREFQFLRPQDRISMNPERLIGDAKALALALVPAYAPGVPRDDIRVEGEAAYASMRLSVYAAREAGQISDYDATIGEALASILSGGRLTGAQSVSEQYLLELERSAFLSLCGNRQTQERIEHMLRTGKPLRN